MEENTALLIFYVALITLGFLPAIPHLLGWKKGQEFVGNFLGLLALLFKVLIGTPLSVIEKLAHVLLGAIVQEDDLVAKKYLEKSVQWVWVIFALIALFVVGSGYDQ